MRYGVLGSIDVHDENGRVELGGPQQRRLLAVLLTAPGHLFSIDKLIDALWTDGSPPDGASRAVLTYMSRLRARIGATSIVTRGSGYLLDTSAAVVDCEEFDDLFKRARVSDPDTAIRLYDEALRLWRGPAFDEFAGEWWAIGVVARLEEMRAVAAEKRAGALMVLGQSGRAIPDLEALMNEFPHRERIAALLMQALDSLGRKAEALRVFYQFREALIDNTGLGPSAELVALEDRIVAADGDHTAAHGRPLRGYVLHEVIGRGAHGTVYLAKQPGTERDVAIKVIRAEFADSPEFVRRFESEAQLVARLEHPHIVPLYDSWREPGGAYLVFRLMRGGTAEASLVTGGRWSTDRVGRLVEQVGNAMVTAHAAGVAHRDIRSANILLDEADNMFISDFGIAAERLDGDAVADTVGDVRDLALTLWELLAGSPANPSNWSGVPPSLSARVPDLSPAIDAVVARAASGPGRGFESMAELVLAWRAAIGRQGPLGPVGNTADRTSSDRRLAARQLSAQATAGVNPYRGLRPFGEADAREYFGRSAITEDLVDAVVRSSFVALVGPSGSGKSSLVHAGLAPAIRRSDDRLVASMKPGDHPIEALYAAMTMVSLRPLEGTEATGWIHAVAAQLRGGLVLIVDQFEECWTLADAAERDAFLAAISARPAEGPSVSVVVAIRADMYDRPLQDPAVGALVAASTFPVTPMSAAELDDAVQLPAARAHVSFEDGVAASVIAEAIAHPASLPLLQFTLFQLFEQRMDGRITASAYDQLGGMAGAIARRADDLYRDSTAQEQDQIRLLFQRLVNPGLDGAPDSRRRALLSELTEPSRMLADQFVAARLLVRDHDRVTREPTIEVAHEAILTRWDRLAEWIDDDREWLRRLTHLSVAARTWQQDERSSAELYRGSRLEAAIEALPDRRHELTADEIAFIEAGQRARDADLDRQRRSVRRFRRALVGVALLLVLASIAAIVAVAQRHTADRSTRTARISALVGEITALRSTHRDTAALLAVEAYRLTDTPATRSALLSTFTASSGFLDTRHLESDRRFFASAVMPASGAAFVTDQDNLVHSYDRETGQLGPAFERAVPVVDVDNFTGAGNHPGENTASSLVPSPDGTMVAQALGVRSADGSGATTIAFLDLATRRHVGPTIHADLTAGNIVFSPDQRELVVSGAADGTTIAFDAATGAELARRPGQLPDEKLANQIWQTAGLAFLDAGRLAIGSVVDTIQIVEPLTLQPIGAPIRVPLNSAKLLFAIDNGATLIGAGRKGVVRVDVTTGNVNWALDSQHISVDGCHRLAVAAEHHRFYCSDSFGSLSERSLDDGSPVRQLDVQNGAAETIWPTRNGTELVAFGNDEPVVTRWRLDGSGPITRRITPGVAGDNQGQYSPNGASLLGRTPTDSSFNDTARNGWVIIDPATGVITRRLGSFNYPFWNTDNVLGGALVTDTGFQLAAYHVDTGKVTVSDNTLTRTITNNVNNSGQPAAWISMPNDGTTTSDIWTLSRRDGSRIGPTVVVDSLVLLAGSPNGRRFAVTTTNSVRVYDVASGNEIARIENRPDLRGIYYVDDDLIAISSLSGEVTLHDSGTLALVRTLGGSRGFVQDLQATRDGSMIAFDGGDRTLQLIDVATGTPIGGPIPVSADEWNGFVLQPQGHEIAVGGGTSEGIAIWDLDPAHWAEAACRVAGRNLTHDEWSAYIGPLGEYHATCP